MDRHVTTLTATKYQIQKDVNRIYEKVIKVQKLSQSKQKTSDLQIYKKPLVQIESQLVNLLKKLESIPHASFVKKKIQSYQTKIKNLSQMLS